MSFKSRFTIPAVATIGFCLIGGTVPAVADIINVPGDYPTIQAGIDAAMDGDEVVVADGVYTGDGNRDIDFGGKLITVRSENGPANCIIDCQGTAANPHRGFYFHSGETTAAIVEGFTITGGYMTGPNEADNKGGAFYVEASAATIRHCVFTDNTVDQVLFGLQGGGGALGAVEAILDISDCVFSQNRAIGSCTPFAGALIALSSTLTFTRCTMTNNTAGSYGAALILGVTTWIDCTVADNTATAIASSVGGLGLFGDGPHVLQGCEITGNQAEQRGGGWANNSTLEDCLIANNIADHKAGGFAGTVIRNSVIRDNHSGEGSGGGSFSVVENCVITGNTTSGSAPGGVAAGTVSRCLIMGNSSVGGDFVPFIAGGVLADRVIDSIVVGNTSTVVAGGIHVSSEVLNCLVIGNSAPRGAGILAQQGDARIVNCTVVGNTATVAGGGVASLGWAVGNPITATVSNCIVWGNSAPVGAQLAALDFICVVGHPSELSVAYTDSQGGQAAAHADRLSTLTWGSGNIDADPLFVDPDGGDYRLSSGSPSIDAGNTWGVPVDEFDYDEDGVLCELFPVDLDGNPRFNADEADFDPGCGVPVVVDMGAYEYQFDPVENVVFADLNADGAVGVADLLGLLGSWGPCAKGCCLADLDIDGNVGVSDFLALLANWGPCP